MSNTTKTPALTITKTTTMELTWHADDERRATTPRNRRTDRHVIEVYVWPKNESIMENLVNRRSRPHEVWQGYVAEALAKLGVEKEPTLFRWDQRCGCTCQCSPGFIVRLEEDDMQRVRKATKIDHMGINIHINVEEK